MQEQTKYLVIQTRCDDGHVIAVVQTDTKTEAEEFISANTKRTQNMYQFLEDSHAVSDSVITDLTCLYDKDGNPVCTCDIFPVNRIITDNPTIAKRMEA